MLRTIDGVKTIGHGGGTKGQSTALVIAPEQGFGLAVFTNHSLGGVVTDRVVDKAREVYLGIREPELEPIELDPAPYVGRYTARMADIDLVETESGLELRFVPKGGFPTPDTPPEPPPPPASVRFATPDELFAVDDLWKGERILFLRDADGRIEWMRAGGRVLRRQTANLGASTRHPRGRPRPGECCPRAPAGVAGCRTRRVRARAAGCAAAARLRGGGPRPDGGARRSQRRPSLSPPGGRLRRVVQGLLGACDQGAAQDFPANGSRFDLGRDVAGRQGRPDRGSVREASDSPRERVGDLDLPPSSGTW